MNTHEFDPCLGSASAPHREAQAPRRLHGTVALVVGATSGIGLAVARRLTREGAAVTITGRDADRLDAAVTELASDAAVAGIRGKAHDPEHRISTVGSIMDSHGRLDILVNCVGANPTFGPLTDQVDQTVHKVLDINLVAALGWARECLQQAAWLDRQNPAAMVNLSSYATLRPSPGLGLYGASKAALNHLTRQLALELAPSVRVNAVAPALIQTNFSSVLYEGREAETIADYPLRRLGLPEDVASAVAFLVSPDAAWITGQTLVIDGGLSLTGGVK